MNILKSCVQAEKKGRPEGSMLSAFIIEKAVLEIEKFLFVFYSASAVPA